MKYICITILSMKYFNHRICFQHYISIFVKITSRTVEVISPLISTNLLYRIFTLLWVKQIIQLSKKLTYIMIVKSFGRYGPRFHSSIDCFTNSARQKGQVLKAVWKAGCCISYDLYSIIEVNDGDNKRLDSFVSENRGMKGSF